MDIFNYNFMQRAIVVAFFISIILPMIGNVIVLKRLSNIGDTLSHASLAGVTIGLCFAFNPLIGAVLSCIACAFLIEATRKFFLSYPEISTSIIMSLAVCITAILSGFIKNNASFNGFLFGSIVAISKQEVITVIVLSIFVVVIMTILYKPLFYISFSEENASASGLPTDLINFIFTLLAAICIGISARIIGAFVVSSILILPVTSAMQISNSYKSNLFLAIVFAMISNVFGLILSYYLNLKPGGAIIFVALAIFFTIALCKKIFKGD